MFRRPFFVSGMCLKMTEIFSSKMAELFSLKTDKKYLLQIIKIVFTGLVNLRWYYCSATMAQ